MSRSAAVPHQLQPSAGPTVTTQPCNQRAVVGSDASFTVAAEGTGLIRYQWWYASLGKHNWRPLSEDDEQYYGTDCPTLKIRRVGESLEGSYKCTIHDDLGEVSSKVVTFLVSNPPCIHTQPCGTDRAQPLQCVSLTVEAEGRKPLQYQWQKKKEDPSSGETFQQKVFRAHTSLLKQFLNVSILHPSLREHGLISSEQSEELAQEVPGNTNARKVDLLLKWLPKSCRNFLEELIVCLREASDHRGHIELAEKLEEGLSLEQWGDVSVEDSHYYVGVDSATLTISKAEKKDEGSYRCLVTNRDGCALSQSADISLAPDNSAVEAFVAKLQSSPGRAKELGNTFISKLEPKSTDGYRALLTVAKMGPEHAEVVQAFLDAGWSPDFSLEDGKTLVHILAEQGNTEALSLALQRGGERAVTAADKDDRTPLHLAASAGHHVSIKILLQHNTRCMNYQDKELNTALHLATMADHLEAVRILLNSGANPTVENKQHKRPLEVAQERGRQVIIQALETTSFTYGSPASLAPDNLYRAYSAGAWSNGRNSRATSDYGSWDGGSLRHGLAVMEIQQHLTNYTGTLTGKEHLKSGPLKKCTKKGELKQRHFFLFSDVLLHTKLELRLGGHTKYCVIDEMSVRGMEVLDPKPPAVRNQPHSFTVKSKERGLNLVARSAEEKSSWMEALQQAIDALSTKTNSDLPEGVGLGAKAPVMVPDSHVSMCQACDTKFTAVVRKHHCRNCGKVVCGRCSSYKVYLPYLKKKERVCKKCIEGADAVRKLENKPGHLQELSAYDEDTVMSGYVKRLKRMGVEEMWYQLKTDNVLYLFYAHEDKTADHSIPLVGYTVQGDVSTFTIKLCHQQTREELNEAFKLDSFQDYTRWQECLKQRTRN